MEADERSWTLDEELEFLAGAGEDIPDLQLLSKASLGIAYAKERLPLASFIWPDHLLFALSLLGSMGFRTARAVALLVASGYASEALPQVRRLAEIEARAEYLLDDSTGQRASSWLDGRSSRPAKLVGQDYWNYFSPAAHADAANYQWINDESSARLFYFLACRDSRDDLVVLAAALAALDLVGVLYRAIRLPTGPVERAQARVMTRLEERRASENTSPAGPVSKERVEDERVLRLPI